jgi:hypothetical protein
MAANEVEVNVPQTDGEIRIAVGGEKPRAYKVVDHVVKLKRSDLALFLRSVEGAKESKEATPKPGATKDGN